MNPEHSNYNTVYIYLSGTVIIDRKVDTDIIKFVFQCINDNKKLVLLSKQLNEDEADIIQENLIEPLFSRMVRVPLDSDGVDYITDADAIYIDNEPKRRDTIRNQLGIKVYDSKTVKTLFH